MCDHDDCWLRGLLVDVGRAYVQLLMLRYVCDYGNIMKNNYNKTMVSAST